MKAVTGAWIAGAGLLCAGCISIYSQPPATSPIAQVEFRRAVSGFGFQQVLSWTESTRCKKISFIGDYSPATVALGISGRKEFRVAADQPLFLLAETYDSTIGYNRYGKCSNVVGFQPEAGHRYAVTQTYNRMSCSVEVMDLADGSVPVSFTRHAVEDPCMRSR